MALVKRLGMLVVILTITSLETSYSQAGEYINDVYGTSVGVTKLPLFSPICAPLVCEFTSLKSNEADDV